jgi:hypothetical protein
VGALLCRCTKTGLLRFARNDGVVALMAVLWSSAVIARSGATKQSSLCGGGRVIVPMHKDWIASLRSQ